MQHEGARPDGIYSDGVEASPGQRAERPADRGSALPQLLPARQPPVEPKRRLLAARAEERPDPPRLQAELEQPLQGLGLLDSEAAFVDRRDQPGELVAVARLAGDGVDGLRLGERDLALLGAQQ
jgi:hypothetical protein